MHDKSLRFYFDFFYHFKSFSVIYSNVFSFNGLWSKWPNFFCSWRYTELFIPSSENYPTSYDVLASALGCHRKISADYVFSTSREIASASKWRRTVYCLYQNYWHLSTFVGVKCKRGQVLRQCTSVGKICGAEEYPQSKTCRGNGPSNRLLTLPYDRDKTAMVCDNLRRCFAWAYTVGLYSDPSARTPLPRAHF